MIQKMEDLTWFELDKLDRDRTLIFLTISPLEQHGPHLPLGMDLFGAEYLSRRMADAFQERRPDWTILLTPPMALGSNAFDFPGSIFTRRRVLHDLLVDYGSSLARHGFLNIVVTSVHGGTGHLVAMEEAADVVSKRFKARMIAPSGAIAAKFFTGAYLDELDKVLPAPLTAEDRERLRMDWHAGWWETSLMLLVRPDLVKDDFVNLDPVLVEDFLKINDNLCRTVGGGRGYLGTPARATREFAEAMVRFFVKDAVDIIERVVGNAPAAAAPADARSPLSKIPVLRGSFVQDAVLGGALVLLTALGALPLVEKARKSQAAPPPEAEAPPTAAGGEEPPAATAGGEDPPSR